MYSRMQEQVKIVGKAEADLLSVFRLTGTLNSLFKHRLAEYNNTVTEFRKGEYKKWAGPGWVYEIVSPLPSLVYY